MPPKTPKTEPILGDIYDLDLVDIFCDVSDSIFEDLLNKKRVYIINIKLATTPIKNPGAKNIPPNEKTNIIVEKDKRSHKKIVFVFILIPLRNIKKRITPIIAATIIWICTPNI